MRALTRGTIHHRDTEKITEKMRVDAPYSSAGPALYTVAAMGV
jgi:hypothetical protein